MTTSRPQAPTQQVGQRMNTTGETLACLKSPVSTAPLLGPPRPTPLHFRGEEGQVAESRLGGELPFPLRYFHKPIIADHLGRLRPCLSPIQLGRRGGSWAAQGSSTRAGTRLPWERAVGAKRRSPGEGCGGVCGGSGGAHRCTRLHPERGQGARPGRACSLRSRAPGGGAATSRGGANEMQIQAEGRASEKEGPAVRT